MQPVRRGTARGHVRLSYEIREGDKVERFAAGEFSNCAWGFYVPA
jgi:hypothetical protein